MIHSEEESMNKSMVSSSREDSALSYFEEQLGRVENLADSLRLGSEWNAKLARGEVTKRSEHRILELENLVEEMRAQVSRYKQDKLDAEKEMAERTRIAEELEVQATKTACAAALRAQALAKHVESLRAENDRLKQIIRKHQSDASQLQQVLREDAQEQVQVKYQLAMELESEREKRNKAEAQLAAVRTRVGTQEDCQRMARTVQKLKEKVAALEAKVQQGQRAMEAEARLKDEVHHLKDLLRSLSKQKPLFDKIKHVLAKKDSETSKGK